jgi:hypothetical protein
MAPIVHGLEAEYSKQINFVYLDLDDPRNQAFLSELGFLYQPHFFLIDGDGNIIQQWLGPVTAEQFREAFSSALK